MSDDAQAAFHEALNTLMHANAFMPERFKRKLVNKPDLPKNILIRDGLRAAIDNSSMTPEVYEGLTDAMMVNQEDMDAWLKSLWAYVYEDGPEPE